MSDPLWMREDWKTDSLKWRGEVLKGKYAHWCNEWDGLPVDETTEEFEACLCFPELTAEARRALLPDEQEAACRYECAACVLETFEREAERRIAESPSNSSGDAIEILQELLAERCPHQASTKRDTE